MEEKLKIKIQHDIEVNKRCLEELTHPGIRKMLELWNKYDEELLEILEEVNDENNR